MRVYWHDDALLHDTGAGIFEHPPSPLVEVPELHPENAERIRNIRAALRNGLTPDEIGEVLLQSAVYCGVPAANAAFAVANRVLEEEVH